MKGNQEILVKGKRRGDKGREPEAKKSNTNANHTLALFIPCGIDGI